MRIVARIKQVDTGVRSDGPVVVLSATVDAGKRLLVQQADHAVVAGYALQRDHDQLLVVTGHVGVLEDRSDLVLAGGHLVVARLDRNAEAVELFLGFDHAAQDAIRDRAEVVVIQLLAARRLGADEGPTARHEIGTTVVVFLVDEEVFLLDTHG